MATNRAHEVVFHLCVLGNCTKSSTEEEKKTATDATIAALGEFDFEVWTDGSLKEKVGAGAGLISPKRPRLATRVFQKASKF